MDPLCCHHLSLFLPSLRPSLWPRTLYPQGSGHPGSETAQLLSAVPSVYLFGFHHCLSGSLTCRLSRRFYLKNFSFEELFFSAITALFFFFRSLRAISTARLSVSPHVHLRPIDVVVSDGPLTRSYLGAGFVLRCFQHLSCPDAATRLCSWRNNRRTGGLSNTVLSY